MVENNALNVIKINNKDTSMMHTYMCVSGGNKC